MSSQYDDDNNSMIEFGRWLHKAKKTCAFIIVDILMTYLFVYLWYKYIEKRDDAFHESTVFIVWMEIFFISYYYIFDYFWIHIKDHFNI
jgi:hypothetical protein